MNIMIEHIYKIIKNEYFLVSIIIILAFGVRLYRINSPIADWHSWRQADTASVSKIYVERGIDFLFPRYHDISSIQTGIFNKEGLRLVEFPLFNAIHATLYKSAPQISLEVWGRLTSIFSSLFSTFLIFLIGRKFIGKWGGLLASFFFAFLPFNVYFSRVILPEPMAVAFGLLSLWLFVKFIDSERSWLLFSSAAVCSIAILIKPFVFFYAAPAIYLALKKYGIRKIIFNWRFLVALDITLVPFFLWRAWINQYPAGIPFWQWAFNGDRIRFRPSFWKWIFGERFGRLILGVWGIVPFSFGLLDAKKKNYFNLVFLLGSILYITLVATANVRHDYYQIVIIPPLALLVAQGTIKLWESNQFSSWIAKPLIIFSLAMMFIVSATEVREFYKINHPEIIRAGQEVDRLVPKEALVVAPYNGDTAFLYQTGRSGWPAIDDSIDNIIKKGADYYVSVDLASPDTKMVLERFNVIQKTDEFVIVELKERKK